MYPRPKFCCPFRAPPRAIAATSAIMGSRSDGCTVEERLLHNNLCLLSIAGPAGSGSKGQPPVDVNKFTFRKPSSKALEYTLYSLYGAVVGEQQAHKVRESRLLVGPFEISHAFDITAPPPGLLCRNSGASTPCQMPAKPRSSTRCAVRGPTPTLHHACAACSNQRLCCATEDLRMAQGPQGLWLPGPQHHLHSLPATLSLRDEVRRAPCSAGVGPVHALSPLSPPFTSPISMAGSSTRCWMSPHMPFTSATRSSTLRGLQATPTASWPRGWVHSFEVK